MDNDGHRSNDQRTHIDRDGGLASNGPVDVTTEAAIIGGGLAGLAAANFLARSGRSVTVFERSRRLGGNAKTDEREGFSFNQGPHALYRTGAAETVLGELGVVIRGGTPGVKGGLVRNGRVDIAPAGPLSLLRTRALAVGEKIEIAKVLARLPKLDPSAFASTTVSDWIDDAVVREGSRAMLGGVCRLSTYVADLDVLSAEVAIGQTQLALGAGVRYLHDGWQPLVDQLEAKLRTHPSARIVRGEPLDRLPNAPVVIVAAGGPTAAARLLGVPIASGPAARASCLDLGLRRAPDHPFLIGADEPFYFSNHSAVADLAPAGYHHAAAVQYLGEGDTPDPDAIERFVRLAGVGDDDVVVRRRLHDMTTVSAIATASNGGLRGRPTVADFGRPGVFVAGDWVGHEGHLADAALASAREAAMAAIDHLETIGARSPVDAVR